MPGTIRNMALFAALLPGFCFAQSSMPLSFYNYYNYYDVSGVVLNAPKGGCDSFFLLDIKNRKLPKDDVTCTILDSAVENLRLLELSGVIFTLDGAGNIYARDAEAKRPKIFVSTPPAIDANQPTVIIATENADNQLDVCYFTLKNYRVGGKKPPVSQCVKITIDDIVLSATGRLSESKRAELAAGITYTPKDRKISDTLIVFIPTENMPPDLRLFGFIYDMKGNVIRLQIGLHPGENLIFRETLLPGTYKFFIMLDEYTELTRQLIFMQEPPRLHEED